MNTKEITEAVVNEPTIITPADIAPIIKSHHDLLRWNLKTLGKRNGLTAATFSAMPGLGKSQIGEAVVELLGRIWSECRAGSVLPSDIRIPAIDLKEEIIKYLGNTELPFIRKDGSVKADDAYMIMWDELGDASHPVLKILKEAMNDNRVGNLSFPIDTLHVAFLNGMKHGCRSEKQPLANVSRTARYEVMPSTDEAMDYFTDHVVDYRVLVAFLACNKTVPYSIDVKKWDGESNFASFRTLEEFGKRIIVDWSSDRELEDGTVVREFTGASHDPLALAKLNAILGYEAATKAKIFMQIYESVGSIAHMLEDPDNCKLPDPNDTGTVWVIACRLVGEANSTNMRAIMRIAKRLLGGISNGWLETYVAKSICKASPNLITADGMRQWVAANSMNVCGRG